MSTTDVDEMYEDYENKVNKVYEVVYNENLIRFKEPLSLKEFISLKFTPDLSLIKDKIILPTTDITTLVTPIQRQIIREEY